MKRSIAKQTALKILFFIIAAMAAVSVILFFVIKDVIINSRTELAKRTLDTARMAIVDFMQENDMTIYDDDLSEEFPEIGDYICNRYNIDYLYIYHQDFDSKDVTYILITENDQRSSYVPQDYKSHTANMDYDDETLRVWNGESEYQVFYFNNKYGHELGIISVIKDSDGNQEFIGVDMSYDEIYSNVIQYFIMGFVGTLLFLLIIFFLIYRDLHKRILTPVKQISEAMSEYAESDCKAKTSLELKSYGEFRMISDSFNKMTDEINSYISHVQTLTKERERGMAEMKVAEKIQSGLLQKPDFDTPQFRVRAMMKPARKVGGDLYDYYQIDDDNILLIVADVSGKGVTAAIFMAMLLTTIRQLARTGNSPDEILTSANKTMSESNPLMMFVTSFMALYNRSSDMLTYSNAGHNPPYILRDKKLIKLESGTGCPLGMFDDEEYSSSEIQLKGDDILFMFTDGVNEAVNGNREFYSTERLEQTLINFSPESDGSLIDYIYGSVKDFCGDTEQSDDITMLAMAVNHRTEISLNAEEREFSKIKNTILESSIPKQYKLKLCLACEEWFTNICMYGYDSDAAEKTVKFTLEVSDRVKIVFVDKGREYNPLEDVASKDDFDLDSQIGGLGKMIIISIADKVDYRYNDGRNILTIIKNIDEETT